MDAILHQIPPLLSINVKNTLIPEGDGLDDRAGVSVDGQTEGVDGEASDGQTEPSIGRVIFGLAILVVVENDAAGSGTVRISNNSVADRGYLLNSGCIIGIANHQL